MRRTPWLIGLSLALGVTLRAWQWLAGRSLWVDELWIAQNVRDRDLGQLLFTPLDHRQMAPPGFLASVEVSTWLFGLDERALRLAPFLMALLALVLVWRVGRRFLAGGPLAGAVLLSAASPALTWYGGEVKQYAGDIALSLLLVLLALRHLEEPSDMRRAAWAAGLGAVAMISSHAAVLTGAVVGAVLLGNWIRERRSRRRLRADMPPPCDHESPGAAGNPEVPGERLRMLSPLLVIGAGWGTGAAAATWTALGFTTPELRDYMRAFWAEGFAPYADGFLAIVTWIPERTYHVLAHYLVFLDSEAGALAAPTAILAVGGLVVALRKDRTRTLVLLAPFVAALLGGLTHTLPIRNRVAVHAGAPLLLLGMIGLQALLQHRSRWLKGMGLAAGALAVLPIPAIVLSMSRPPYRSQETRPVLATLATRMRENETLYVYCQAQAAADFYGPAVGITDYIEGGCHDSVDDFIEELRALPPGRIWFFYTQWTPTRPYPDAARTFFEANGRELGRIDDPYGLTGQSEATAILYQWDGTTGDQELDGVRRALVHLSRPPRVDDPAGAILVGGAGQARLDR